jgi:ABC-type uncharacterized transport system permease subunit
MASKYAQVFQRLEKTLNTDPSYQSKVEAVKAELKADPDFKMQASALAADYATLRRQKDTINAELSEVQVELDATFQLMAEAYEIEGTTSLTLENGDVIRVQPTISVSFPDPEAFRLWCLADADLSRKMVLHASTAKSLVSQMLLDGQSEPPGAKASFYDQPVLTKGKV